MLSAFALRFEGDIPPDYVQLFLWGLPIVLAIYGIGLVAFGIQRGLWRYVGLHDLGRILWASVVSSWCSTVWCMVSLGGSPIPVR